MDLFFTSYISSSLLLHFVFLTFLGFIKDVSGEIPRLLTCPPRVVALSRNHVSVRLPSSFFITRKYLKSLIEVQRLLHKDMCLFILKK